MLVGKNIKKLRESSNLSQRELANRLFVTNKTISSWEQGRTEPNLEMIASLAKILNCTIENLLFDITLDRKPNVRVGIGVIIKNEDKILLGHRAKNYKDTGGIYEPDTWTIPGGKQEFNETILEGAIREVKEETNLDITNLEIFGVADDKSESRHFITVHIIANDFSGTLINREPENHTEWKWFNINELPTNLYTPAKKFIEEYKDKTVNK